MKKDTSRQISVVRYKAQDLNIVRTIVRTNYFSACLPARQATLRRIILCSVLLTTSYLLLTTPVNAASDKFIGVNMHSFIGKEPSREARILDYLANSCGVNIIRVFFSSDQSQISGLKQTLDAGNKYGVKYIVALGDYANRPNDLLPFGLDENPTDWYKEGYKKTYKPHIEKVVTEFKDNPNIYAWELANEPHCNGHEECRDPYSAWVKDMSDTIKSIDPNHPISIGTMARGDFDFGDSITNGDYKKNNSLSNIGLVTGHYYDGNINGVLFEKNDLAKQQTSILNDLEVAKKINKPFYVGEAGFVCGTENCTQASAENEARRAQSVSKDIDTLFGAGANGYLIWQYSDRKDLWTENDSFSFFEGDPICQVLKQKSQQYQTSSGTTLPTLSPEECANSHQCSLVKQNIALLPPTVSRDIPPDPPADNFFVTFFNQLKNVFGYDIKSGGKFSERSNRQNSSEIPEAAQANNKNAVDQTGQDLGSKGFVDTSTNSNVKGIDSQKAGIGIYPKNIATQAQTGAKVTCDFEKLYENANFPTGINPITYSGCK